MYFDNEQIINQQLLHTGDNHKYYLDDDEKEIIIHGIKHNKTVMACWVACWSDKYLERHPVPRNNFMLFYCQEYMKHHGYRYDLKSLATYLSK